MQKVAELADVIIREHPEIADDYRAGLTQPEIAFKHSLHKGVTVKVARMAVGRALKTLIPDEEEMEKLSKAIMFETAKKNGRQSGFKGGMSTFKAKVGIFALSEEEKIRIAKYANECLTPEVRRQIIQTMLAKEGKIQWITNLVEPASGFNEIDYLLSLTKNPEYIIQNGSNKGCNDSIKIAAKLNEVFHQNRQVRTSIAVRTQLVRLRLKESQKS
jgi:hypothetical protein